MVNHVITAIAIQLTGQFIILGFITLRFYCTFKITTNSYGVERKLLYTRIFYKDQTLFLRKLKDYHTMVTLFWQINMGEKKAKKGTSHAAPKL